MALIDGPEREVVIVDTKLIDKVMRRMDEIDARLAHIDKTFTDNGSVRGGNNRVLRDDGMPQHDVLRKAFTDARGSRKVLMGTGGFGGDGASLYEVNLDGYYAGGRAKGLGQTEAWRALAAVGYGSRFPETGWNMSSDGDPVKVLEKAGFRNPGQRWGHQKAPLAEGSGFSGGYTVPTQFYADLLRLMAEKAFVREKCTVLPMQSRSLLIPALRQSSTTFNRGQSQFFGGVVMTWTPEAVGMTETEPIFREIELVAADLMFYTSSSNQLLQDNAIALDTLLTTIFQEAVAWSYDFFILNGNAGNEPQGIITAPGTYGQARTAVNSILLPDIANMMSRLYAPSWDNACWIANPSAIPQLVRMTNNATNADMLTWLNMLGDGDGGPISRKFPATLAGLPIYWSEKAAYLGTAGDLILADLSKYLIGDRLSIQVEASPHPGFTRNQMYWRVITRWTGQPWVDSPITLADQTMTVSPYVILNANVL